MFKYYQRKIIFKMLYHFLKYPLISVRTSIIDYVMITLVAIETIHNMNDNMNDNI